MRTCILLTAIAVSSVSLLAAQERFDGEAHAKAIAPFVDDQTILAAHVDLSKVDVSAVFKLLKATGVFPEKELEMTQGGATMALKLLTDAGVKHVYALRSITGGPHDFFIAIPLGGGVQGDKLLQLFKSDPGTKVFVRDNTIVAGPAGAVQQVELIRPSPRPEFGQAFTAAGDGAVQVVVAIPTTLRKALLEMMPALPKELDAASMTVLTKGLQWATLKADTTPEVSFRLQIRSQDKQAAEDLNRLLGRLITLAKTHIAPQVPELAKVIDLVPLQLQNDSLVATLTTKDILSTGVPLLRKVRESAERAQDANNLKQIALAMHNYYDTHKGLPTPANYDKKGKALLSWRVHILPYVDHSNLYQQFKLDEPWDSEHNKRLIPMMPPVYRSPHMKGEEKGLTTYLVPVGASTLFPGKKAVKFQDVTDGTSNTLLVVETAEESAVIWTKPDDWKFDPKNPTRGLSASQSRAFHVATADGAVHTLPKNIDGQLLMSLVTRNGGEAIQWPN